MVTLAKVNIWDTFVGGVVWMKDRGYSVFEFDTKFLNKNWDLAPLKMSIEEARERSRIFSFQELNKKTFHGLPGMLADSLPDRFGNRLMEAWLARQGRSLESMNPVEQLCYTGKRGMGALEYEPVIHPFSEDSTELEVKQLVDLAREVLNKKSDLKVNLYSKNSEAIQDIIRVGTSAGGARAKAVIAYNEKTGEVRSGQVDRLKDFDYWIIKFDGVSNEQLGDPKGYGMIEYAYYKMALECGIQMSKCRLLEENERNHFMTKRFDRGKGEKLHLQTLCALAHYDYNSPSEYSYEQAFQVMRELKLPYSEMEQLFHRMIFNIVARNQDDHTKNISFLMDKTGRWKLSPAYDVTYAFDPQNKWIHSHQLSVNGKRDNVSKEDILTVARQINIKKPNEIIEKIKDTVSKWKEFAKDSGVDSKQINLIKNTFLLQL